MSEHENPQVESADVHALEAMVDRYGFLELAEMLAEIAEERDDLAAQEAFDQAADLIEDGSEADDGRE